MEVSKEIFDIIKQRYIDEELIIDEDYEIKNSDESYSIRVVGKIVIVSRYNGNELIEDMLYQHKKMSNKIEFDGDKKIVYNYSTYHEGKIINIKYYKNEKLHRIDGPALEYANPTWEDYYYVGGRHISLAFFNKIRKNLKRGSLGNILERYEIEELEVIKEFVLEMGSEKDLERVNKYILIKKLEGKNDSC